MKEHDVHQAGGQQPQSLPDDPMADPKEEKHFLNVMNSFLAYRRSAHYSVTHVRRQSFYAMPSEHWNKLANPPFHFLDHLEKVDDAIDANAQIAEECLQSALDYFKFPPWDSSDETPPPWSSPSKPSDQSKAYSTIKQLYRDWSAEGFPERAASYGPVLRALEAEFADSDKARVRVLVPGAGLGRLLFEIVLAGYCGEGNEISYHQIIVSNHILNNTARAGQYILYPWALGFSNHLTRADQLQSVLVPDIQPASVLLEAAEGIPADDPRHPFNRMSMGSGDFCVSYKEPASQEAFDAVTTVFFIDTAPNIISYIETVKHCLRPNGIWINVGPLLWHFEDNPRGHQDSVASNGDLQGTPVVEKGITSPRQTDGASYNQNLGIGEAGSVELTEEDVIALLDQHGFKIEKHETDTIETGYMQNSRSMLSYVYKPSFWIARKIG